MFVPEIPDNSLKPQLEELAYIINKITAETDEKDQLRLKFNFEPPATESEIKDCESALGMSLPLGYKDFLRFSNGAQLCGHTAEFENISYVVAEDRLKKAPDFPKDYVFVASLIGDGEMLCFSRETGKFIRYFDGEETEYDDFYTFFNWLIRFIKDKAEDYVEL